MGNSCTREADVVLSERGVGGARGQGHDKVRGRWSVPEYQESVDLDTLLEAPSPQAAHHRRRRGSRSKSRSEKPRSNSNSGSFGHKPAGREGNNGSRTDRKKSAKSSRKPFGRPMSTTHEEEEVQDYRSYEDPGYMNQELMHVDSDCILQSPFDSPSSPKIIHARWGEPAEDPEEKEVCMEYRPNPFKLGFCVNCQKQHDVNENGDVASSKEYTKIARPAVSKTAANALDNPAAVDNLTPRNRESDVDLAALLQQRRDILLRLTKMEQEKAKKKKELTSDVKPNAFDSSVRHTMFVTDSSGTTLANLRRVGSAGYAGPTAPQSLRVGRTTSSVVVSPRNVSSMRGLSKSISFGGHLDDDEPARNDWL